MITKKKYTLENLGCAGCASKMEAAISRIDGVKGAAVSFISKKLIVEADENVHEAIFTAAAAICKKIEPDCKIIKQNFYEK